MTRHIVLTRAPLPLRHALISLCLLGACGIALSACGSSAPSVPTRHIRLISILEDDGLLIRSPGPTLRAVRRLGVEVVRFDLRWRAIAPDPAAKAKPAFDARDPSSYPPAGWTVPDRIVRDARADGLRVYFTLTGPAPIWAAGPGMPRPSPKNKCPCGQWKPSVTAFGAFVHAVGERYSGHYTPPGASSPLPRVSFWAIWNEPNYGPDLAPQATDGSKLEVSPDLYRGLLDAGWRALAATGHTPASDTILIGETAPFSSGSPPGDFNGMVPLRFIRALYCVDMAFRPLRGDAAALRGCPTDATGSRRFAAANPALFRASGWADHPYQSNSPPTLGVPGPAGAGFAGFAELGNLERTLDRSASAYGGHLRLPIYSTEFGYKTNPAHFGYRPNPTNAYDPSPAEAAAWLNEVEYISWRSQRIRSYDQYLLEDPSLSASQYDTGLVALDGRRKPDVYAAFRMPIWLPRTTGPARSPLVVWGCVRPAPSTGRPQRVAIQLASLGSSDFRTVRTVTVNTALGCYFATSVVFGHSGTVRLAWSGAGPTLYSRTQPITLR